MTSDLLPNFDPLNIHIKKGDTISTRETLSNMFGYFKAMRTCHAKLRYFDWDGQVHLAKGKTGGQQGDPLEMLVFNLTIHHLWGRVLSKFPGARAVAYADDGYIKAKLSVALQVLAELKRVLKEDAGLELNVAKTSVLPKGVSQQAAFDVAQNIIQATPTLFSGFVRTPVSNILTLIFSSVIVAFWNSNTLIAKLMTSS